MSADRRAWFESLREGDEVLVVGAAEQWVGRVVRHEPARVFVTRPGWLVDYAFTLDAEGSIVGGGATIAPATDAERERDAALRRYEWACLITPSVSGVREGRVRVSTAALNRMAELLEQAAAVLAEDKP